MAQMKMDTNVVRQQIDSLLLQYPELQEDDQLRADMIEGETDAHEFLRMLERMRQEACSMAGALATNIAQIEGRLARFERREQAVRGLIFKILDAANQKRLELPEATLSIVNGQQKLLGEADPASLPDSLCKIKREIDRKAVKEAIKTGQTVPGFTLSNAEPHLAIRTK
jgi:hypothetical protein